LNIKVHDGMGVKMAYPSFANLASFGMF